MKEKDLVLEKEYEFSDYSDFKRVITARLVYINNKSNNGCNYIAIDKDGIANYFSHVREIEKKPKFIESEIEWNEDNGTFETVDPFYFDNILTTKVIDYGAIGYIFDEFPDKIFNSFIIYRSSSTNYQYSVSLESVMNEIYKPIYAKKVLWLNK